MRYVIFGAGAIGGVLGARLHQADQDVMLIARGAHYEALATTGLEFATPAERVTLQIPVAPTAAAAKLREGDVVVLCTKSQHSREALGAIRDAAPDERLPIVCMQNGVANERAALRLFANVYAATAMIPAEHLQPGYVIGYTALTSGRVDLGRYPHGSDALCDEIGAALRNARFECDVHADVQRYKYAKLVNNLQNGIEMVCGLSDPQANAELTALVQAEGRRVLDAAGIAHDAEQVTGVEQRWRRMGGIGEVDGHGHRGGSSWQSVARGTGNVETDYFNGEIVLLGRELGLATPYNAMIQRLAQLTARDRLEPGWQSARELIASLG